MRILVVDDDEVDRLACRRTLTRAEPDGLEIIEAHTAHEAIVLVGMHAFDCLLLDFGLPDMDGIELMQRLLATAGAVRAPMVMLTGADDVSVAVEAMRHGASDYLVKDVEGRYRALIPAVVHRAIKAHQIQREKLRAEAALARYREELSDLTRQLMTQEKVMTRRIAQSLHDRLGQTLAAMRLLFDAMQSAARGRVDASLQPHAERLGALIDQAVREVRQVLVDLRPPLLDEHGLAAALENELRSQTAAHPEVQLRLEVDPDCAGQRWPADVEYAAFMIAREALTNALRHALPSWVRVRLSGTDKELRLQVIDDGCGIEDDLGSVRPGHLGMVGMRERAAAIGALHAVARNESGGTTVALDWECAA